VEKFLITSGSNTVLEDIAEGLANIMQFGKAKLTKHPKRQPKTPKKLINKPASLPVNSGLKVKVPQPISTPAVGATNLINLLGIINSQLQDVISANMGDGSSRSLLNYRTGRFASSATVKNLSESRNGMITAFYSYMKNPYATFSSGGRQQSPQTRDPKLLISKSIREIAQQQVANRLRAVAI
jgi:hypothetical protein